MYVTRLDIANLRIFERASLMPGPGLNVISGDNGAGKSSLLEALHLLGYGRSFRGRVRDGLVRAGAGALEVFATWTQADSEGGAEREVRAGLRHTGASWEARLDGAAVTRLGDIFAKFAIVTFDPGSHALVTGPGEARRRYLDWGLFHVEPEFMGAWRRYSRALKQRNALLKTRASGEEFDPWETEMATSGEQIDALRRQYLATLEPVTNRLAGELAPALGNVTLEYQAGWKAAEMGLADAIMLSRERDRQAGFTSVGIHRADFRFQFGSIPGREALSRGQGKLTALCALLAQAHCHAATTGDWPVVALDDLPSELDRGHQARVIGHLGRTAAQVFVTGVEPPEGAGGVKAARFHVKHGQVRPQE